MKRKLSSMEHMIDGNIVYFVRLQGHFQMEQLEDAIARLQYKHPALRMLIREEQNSLYYEYDCAPQIPLHTLRRIDENDFRHKAAAELRTPLPYHLPQLRVVWLRSDQEQNLLFVTSHRICDGMSMLTIVREVLRFLHRDEIPAPYAPLSPDDIVGDYRPPHPWKRRIRAHLCNSILALIPGSRKNLGNHEYCLEWSADAELSDALRQRCRSEGVSVHAALAVALNRALLAVLGERKIPAWIESPMDARRGRLAILKSDMIFFGGGSLKLRTSRISGEDFWEQARAVNQNVRAKIDQELQNIPGRYHFFGMLRPLSDAKIRTMVRISEALKVNGSWNRFALSNLGDVVVTEPDAPFRLIDLRLYVHSFNIRLLGLVCYLLNGQMRFYYVGDEKCMSRSQADALQREIMALLRSQIPELRTPDIVVRGRQPGWNALRRRCAATAPRFHAAPGQRPGWPLCCCSRIPAAHHLPAAGPFPDERHRGLPQYPVDRLASAASRARLDGPRDECSDVCFRGAYTAFFRNRGFRTEGQHFRNLLCAGIMVLLVTLLAASYRAVRAID